MSAEPSAEARDTVRRLRYEALDELIDLLISLLISGREASFRGDGWLVGQHLRQARDVLSEVFAVFRLVEPNLAEQAFRRTDDARSV